MVLENLSSSHVILLQLDNTLHLLGMFRSMADMLLRR